MVLNEIEEKKTHFVGRKDVFDELDKFFEIETNKLIVITGVSGIGKSSAAINYAHTQKEKNSKLILRLFDADSKEKIDDEFKNLAEELKIDSKIFETKHAFLNLIKKNLSELNESLFFIFDNVSSQKDVQDYINALPRNVKAIVTTKNKDLLSNKYKTIDLKPFQKQEIEDMINLYLEKYINPEIIAKLKDYFKTESGNYTCYPFTIEKTLAIVKFYFESHPAKNIDEILNHIKKYYNFETQMLLYIVRDEQHERAWRILQYLAFIDGDFISIDLIQSLLKISAPPTEDLKFLKELSLIERTVKRNKIGIKLHELVQKEIKVAISTNDEVSFSLDEIYFKLIEKLDERIKTIGDNPDEKWIIADMDMNHVIYLFNRNQIEFKKIEMNKDILNRVVNLKKKLGFYYFYQLYDYESSIQSFNSILDASNASDLSIDLSSILNNIGCSYENLGDFIKAQEFYNKAISNGLNKEIIATSFNNIGSLYKKKGDFKTALNNFLKAVQIRKSLNIEKDAILARYMNNVGTVYESLDQVDQGLEFYGKALSIFENKYKGDHHDIAFTYNNIGSAYTRLGDIKKSLEYYKLALDMNERLFKPFNHNHAHISTCLNNIGYSYQNLGDFKLALDHFEKALKMNLEIFGEISSDVALSFNNIGFVHDILGKYETALEFYQKSLKIRETVYSGKHQDIAKTINNIGSIYKSLGDVKKANEYYRRSLEINTELYDDQDNSDTALSLDNVGYTYYLIGDSTLGLQFIEKGYEMRKRLYGSSHPDVAKSLNNLGSLYSASDNNKAIEYFKEALNIYDGLNKLENLMGKADVLDNIGVAYTNLNSAGLAMENLLNCLEIKEKLYGKVHCSIAKTCNHLGDVYLSKGDIQNAFDYYKKALDINRITSSHENIDLALSLSNIGLIYYAQQNLKLSIEYLEKAYKIYEKCGNQKKAVEILTVLNTIRMSQTKI